jgi:hypothetical protein
VGGGCALEMFPVYQDVDSVYIVSVVQWLACSSLPSAEDHGMEPSSCQTKDYKFSMCCYLVFVASSQKHNINEKELRLDGSNSGYYVLVEQHIYPRTIVSVIAPPIR